VSVLLGNGDGTFAAARSFAAGSRPSSVAVADVNGDGLLDLAVANNIFGSGTVSVLLGNGDGTFAAARSFAAGSRPYSVAVGDVNGDGLLDLAVANYVSSGTVSVLLGNGDGTFRTTHISYVAGGSPSSVAVGDFNGDGWLDAVTANYGSNDVSILLNDGVWNGGSPGPGGGGAPFMHDLFDPPDLGSPRPVPRALPSTPALRTEGVAPLPLAAARPLAADPVRTGTPRRARLDGFWAALAEEPGLLGSPAVGSTG
jgi:hypothetical protein